MTDCSVVEITIQLKKIKNEKFCVGVAPFAHLEPITSALKVAQSDRTFYVHS